MSSLSYLHVTGDTYGRPIHGQKEISAYPSVHEFNYWQAAEGIYIKPTEVKSRTSTEDLDEKDDEDEEEEESYAGHDEF